MLRMSMAAAAGLMASAPIAAQEGPPMLDAAVAEAVARAESAPRFGLTQTIESVASGERYVVRFDPARAPYDEDEPENSRWVLVEPAEADLSEDALETWRGVRQENDADIDVLMNEPDRLIPEALVADPSDETGLAYTGRLSETMQINGEPPNRAMQRHLVVSFAVDPDTPRISRYSLTAERSFRPMLAARIDAFDLDMTFDEAWPGGPIVLAAIEQRIEGSAFFQNFSEHVRVTYSDFTPLD